MSEEIKDIQTPADVTSEPAAELALKEDSIGDAVLGINYNFLDKDFGYARTLEELEHALDEADAERNDPRKWITPVEFHTRLENKYPWLR